MRPIKKGAPPRAYSKYSDAQPDLIARIGRFCSYCGRFVPSAINVEHKRSKKRYPAEILLWSNFLLACQNCNPTKSHKRCKLDNYLWPDTDNTMRAFRHLPEGIVQKNKNLPKRIRRKASRTIYLMGLDRTPGAFRSPTDRDYRWLDRKRQWDKAMLFRNQLLQFDTPAQRDLIIIAAEDGIFPIWWTVFKGDVEIRKRLREAFLGTDVECFDSNECLKPRAGGQI